MIFSVILECYLNFMSLPQVGNVFYLTSDIVVKFRHFCAADVTKYYFSKWLFSNLR